MGKTRILVFLQTAPEIHQKLTEQFSGSDTVEFVGYDHLDELPLVYDATLYTGLMWFVKKIDSGLFVFLQQLRAMNNRHHFFILGQPESGAVPELYQTIERCEIADSGKFPYEMLQYSIRYFKVSSCKNLFDQPTDFSENSELNSNPDFVSASQPEQKTKTFSPDSMIRLASLLEEMAPAIEFNIREPQNLQKITGILGCRKLYFLTVEKDTQNGTRYQDWENILKDLPGKKDIYDIIHGNREWNKSTRIDLPGDLESATGFSAMLLMPVRSGIEKYGLFIALYDKEAEIAAADNHLCDILSKTLSLVISKNKSLLHLQRSENHFQKLVENAQDGIYQSTPQGKFLYANPALLQMLGYSNLSEITGNFDVRDIYADPAQREEFKSELNRNGSVRNFNCRLKTKDGRILSVMENALIIMKPDNTLVYEGFLRDFTDYEVLKEDLKSSQNFASELMDKANMLVAIADSDNDVFFWNLKAEQVTGYKRSDLIGHPDLFAEMIGLSDKPAINQSGVFTGDERLHICSFRARSNEEKIIGWTRSLFHTRDLGSLQVFFGIDLTETKKLEERLIEARKMEIFAVFASRVARGFDEVFAKGISSLLSLQKKPEINSELQQYLSELDSSLRSGLQLTQQILSLTKRSEFSYRLINPTDLVEQAVMLLKQTCPANIAIDAAFTVAGAIEAEPAQLYQAILNVALNAIEAMPDGGKLTVRTSRIGPDSLRRPKNGELDEKDFIRIEIEDTGIGIRDEDLKHIFDPFFSTKENGKTRGIGLTLTQKIIQEHHGFLQVESRINQGTTVSIYLPVAKKAAQRVAAKQQKPITGSQKQTVMVVDDESIILDLIEDILASDGYKIFTAENGLDAMRIYEVQPMQFDLVILDVIMPKMDGRELFYKMRELNPSVKIIITSGFSKPDIREELLEQGADGFLQKPFTIDVLTNLVHSALE